MLGPWIAFSPAKSSTICEMRFCNLPSIVFPRACEKQKLSSVLASSCVFNFDWLKSLGQFIFLCNFSFFQFIVDALLFCA